MNSIDVIAIAGLAKNISRNLWHMRAELTPGDDRDSRLIDFVNHMETLVQQIETELNEIL